HREVSAGGVSDGDDAGIATWNIEYRRADSPGGGWPNTFLDVGRATDQLRAMARTYPLDLSRVIAIGHSAGGHLAMWLAAADRVPSGSPIARRDPLPLTGAVALAGIADLAEFRTYSRFSCGDVVDGLMGGSPEQVPERIATGNGPGPSGRRRSPNCSESVP
ncbi:MAG: alpha/beta hydrolase, partial [Gemmatimonadota bacterium]